MTSADHNKAIGIMHLIYGGFFTLMTLMMLVMFGFFAALLSSIPEEPGAPPMALFSAFMGIFVVIYALLSIPSLVAGYALLKKKSWARVAAIVASILAGLSFPFGTALCVYSLWFFFGEQGRDYEARQAAGAGEWRGSLNQAAANPGWGAQQEREAEARQHAYQPPPAPPDWRG
jgi:hypothetical protein